MDDSNIQEQIVHIFELVQENRLDEAANSLSSIDVNKVLNSSDCVTTLILIEQNACQFLLSGIKTVVNDDQHSSKYINQVADLNQYIAFANTEDPRKILIQTQLLLDRKVIQLLVNIVDAILKNDTIHHHQTIIILCTWLEAIAHFVHRHDNLATDVLEPLRQSALACVLSEYYGNYLKQSPDISSPGRTFFVRTCSFLTAIFQSSRLSFENALKTAQSYKIVIGIGEEIFSRNLDNFRHYLYQQKTIENDSACLTGVCLLITNCYKHEIFCNDDAYFTFLLRLLKCDFICKGLLPTWTNDSTILADTVMVQLKNASNDSNIRIYLEQNHAADVICPYLHAEYDRLRLQAGMLLGVLLDDAKIRELQIPSDKLTKLYFDAIQHADKSINKCYRRVPIHLLLKALSALVHNESIQISIATLADYFSYLISITDDYNIIYDILWTLSFNSMLHKHFKSHENFLTQLRNFTTQPQRVPDKDVTRSAEGILWNLADRNHINTLPNQMENLDREDANSEK